ncbi:hypothetical protein [Sporomusa aerivorans]|uniref:hypothetical protein n=1 Tax=Sporomusa aerivorans TaxID=204936 RepID=UPI00352AC585
MSKVTSRIDHVKNTDTEDPQAAEEWLEKAMASIPRDVSSEEQNKIIMYPGLAVPEEDK